VVCWLVRGDAIALQHGGDLLAGWLPGDPHVVAGGAGLDQQAHRLGPVARLAGLLTAADSGEGQERAVEPGVAGVDVGPGAQEQLDDRRVPAVGGGVQRLLPEFVAGVGGEAEVEHEGDGAGGARPGGVDDHGPVLAGQPAGQVRVSGENALGGGAVAADTGADEAVDVGDVVGRAGGSQPRGGIGPAGADRQAQRGHAVLTGCGWSAT
jgi:hypothetical protein